MKGNVIKLTAAPPVRFCVTLCLGAALNGCAAFLPLVEPDAIGRGESAIISAPPKTISLTRGVPGRTGPRKMSKDERRLAKWVKQLETGSEVERTHAAFWIGEQRQAATHTLPLLSSKAVNDQSAWVRRACVKALGKVGGVASVPPLKRALRDSNKWVAHSAANVLRRMPYREAKRAVTAYRGI
jgi:hypothetical protein